MGKKKNEKGTFLVNNLLFNGGSTILPAAYRSNATASGGWPDNFGGVAGDTIAAGSLGSKWTLYDWYAENNAGAPAWDEEGTVNGRWRVRIEDNTGNSGNGKSLIWRTGGADYYGAIYYQLLTPPFDIAVYGCRVASQNDPDTFVAAMASGGEFAFTGLALRHPDLTADYEHCVIGYRGGVETLEWKRRTGATEISQGDVGAFASNEPVGDVRVSVDSEGARTWYYRETVGTGGWTEMTSGWNSVTDPTLQNGEGQIACCITAYAFDDFVPDAGYYIEQTVRLDS